MITKKEINTGWQKRRITGPLSTGHLYFVIALVLLSNMASPNTLQKVTYLYNSGWLIETAKEIILIDYVPNGKQQLDSFLFGKLKTGRAANKKSFILITHEHSDHFYEALLQWHHKIEGLTTVLGWNYYSADKSILKIVGRDSMAIGSLKIISHPSTDAGSAFLIKTGDLTFYHGGDHAAWSKDILIEFTNELKFIRSVANKIDIVFIPVVQGKLGGCRSTESIGIGVMLTLEMLNPAMIFPMHLQCQDFAPYEDFAKRIKERFPGMVTKVARSENFPFKF